MKEINIKEIDSSLESVEIINLSENDKYLLVFRAPESTTTYDYYKISGNVQILEENLREDNFDVKCVLVKDLELKVYKVE